MQDVLQRMRTLVVQAANSGTQDANSLGAIKSEIGNLNSQLGNVSSQTKFGSTPLLDSSFNKVFQVGANGGETISLDLSSADVKASTLGATSMKLNALNIVNYSSAGYAAKDSGGVAIAGDAVGGATQGAYAASESTADLAAIDAAIKTVSTARSNIGAVQNQLGYTATNLQTAITNVTASRSNLTDADLATQVTKMTQTQILTSAATSVLAQANSAPQAILKLLQ